MHELEMRSEKFSGFLLVVELKITEILGIKGKLLHNSCSKSQFKLI